MSNQEAQITSEIVSKSFGAELRRIRRRKHLTQLELGARVGTNGSYICRIESGEKFVSAEMLAAICNILKVQPTFKLS